MIMRHVEQLSVVDRLESRVLLAMVTGTVYNDLNANGQRDAGEAGLPGVVVYQTNRNGKLTGGESRATSDAAGKYAFQFDFNSRTFIEDFREVIPSGWQLTQPNDGGYSIYGFGKSNQIFNLDWGNHYLGPTAPVSAAAEVTVSSAPAPAISANLFSSTTTITDPTLDAATTDVKTNNGNGSNWHWRRY